MAAQVIRQLPEPSTDINSADGGRGGRALAAASASRGVRIDHVTCRFGSVLAVDDADIAVEAGKFLTLLGPSGSGKTTLLQMIAGLITPQAGRILIGDDDVTDLAPHRRRIGMVFQNYALFPHLSVADNIAFPLRLRRMPSADIEQSVRSALEMIDLPQVGARRIAELSGGQQQRIALARALVYRPGVLLMDEPLGALDRKLRDQMKFEIKTIQQRLGITVIYVTHDQDEALTMSDLIAVMNHGRIVQLGDPPSIYLRPESRFVAEFVGDSNLLAGIAGAVSDGIGRIETGLGELRGRTTRAGAAPGAKAALMIRPERIGVVRPDSPPEQVVEAVVEQVFFRGEFTELNARTAAGTTLRAKLAGTSQPALRQGSSVRLGWAIADAVVVPDS